LRFGLPLRRPQADLHEFGCACHSTSILPERISRKRAAYRIPPVLKASQCMQIGDHAVNLICIEHLVEGWHIVAAENNCIPAMLVVAGQATRQILLLVETF